MEERDPLLKDKKTAEKKKPKTPLSELEKELFGSSSTKALLKKKKLKNIKHDTAKDTSSSGYMKLLTEEDIGSQGYGGDQGNQYHRGHKKNLHHFESKSKPYSHLFSQEEKSEVVSGEDFSEQMNENMEIGTEEEDMGEKSIYNGKKRNWHYFLLGIQKNEEPIIIMVVVRILIETHSNILLY